MKNLISSIFIFLIFITCNSQSKVKNFSYENFETEIMEYKPNQNEVSDEKFKHAVFVLSEVKKEVKKDPLGFNRADYFNILSSFISLNESKKNILVAYDKFKKSEGSCEYFMSSIFFKSSKFDLIRADIEKQRLICKTTNVEKSAEIDIKTYSSKNNLDYKLVEMMVKIEKLDTKYRKDKNIDWSKQTPIDLENQKRIDSLFTKHKKYIGTSLVGEKFNHVMWAVIQHSNLEMMEKFMPIIQKAVKQKEIGVLPFKMLIDRVYAQKENYQIFGSQGGIELASEEIRKKVIKKYDLQ